MSAGRDRIVFVAANASIDRLVEVDELRAGAIHRPDRVVAVAGGKGLNAARAAATLGGRVTAIALLGGHAGDWIADRLGEAGVDARIVRTTGETRTCMSILDRSTGQLTEVYEPGEPVVPEAWVELEAVVAAELAEGTVAAIALSGSLPPGMPADGYARLVEAAQRAGVPAALDAHGPALRLALAARPAIIKVNASEAAEATGIAVPDATAAASAARVLRAAGADRVVITLGPDGAVAVSAGGAWHVGLDRPAGAYPVGSGDAFLAGLLVAIVRGDPLVDAARMAVAAGAANAARPGAGNLLADDAARFGASVASRRL